MSATLGREGRHPVQIKNELRHCFAHEQYTNEHAYSKRDTNSPAITGTHYISKLSYTSETKRYIFWGFYTESVATGSNILYSYDITESRGYQNILDDFPYIKLLTSFIKGIHLLKKKVILLHACTPPSVTK